MAGRPEEGIAMTERAMRLNPRYPVLYLANLGVAYRLAGRYEEAIATAKRILACQPNFPVAYFILAVSYAQLDRLEEASDARVRIHNGSFPFFLSGKLETDGSLQRSIGLLEQDLAALRKAGFK